MKEEHAFPIKDPDQYGFGMTLRDYFAAKFIVGQVGGGWHFPSSDLVYQEKFKTMARNAYDIADAMLKEREK